MPPTDPKVVAYADHIMRKVEDDIAEGTVPAGVGSFTGLHSCLDANGYLEAAGMPYYDTQAANDLTMEVQNEVTRRLRTPGRPFYTYGTCSFSTHDQTNLVGPDGQDLLAGTHALPPLRPARSLRHEP